MGRLDERLERLERLDLLAGLGFERPDDDHFRHAMLLQRNGGAHPSADRMSSMSLRINHVSINALDLQESVEFYVDLLGAEPITTPNFGIPVQWLALGRTQLHLFERDLTPTSHHHLGITVDDLEPVYRAAERHNAFDDNAFRQPARRAARATSSSSTSAIRAGNLVEIDSHGADRLPDDLRARLKALWDFNRAHRGADARRACSCPTECGEVPADTLRAFEAFAARAERDVSRRRSRRRPRAARAGHRLACARRQRDRGRPSRPRCGDGLLRSPTRARGRSDDDRCRRAARLRRRFRRRSGSADGEISSAAVERLQPGAHPPGRLLASTAEQDRSKPGLVPLGLGRLRRDLDGARPTPAVTPGRARRLRRGSSSRRLRCAGRPAAAA